MTAGLTEPPGGCAVLPQRSASEVIKSTSDLLTAAVNHRKSTAPPQELFQELKRGTRADCSSGLGVLGTFLESVLSCLDGV